MKKLLTVAAVAEAAMGVALLVIPPLVGRLLLGAELTGIAITVARVTGIALIGLAVACWPGTPLTGMLTCSTLTTFYFFYLGLSGVVGILLWPAIVAHAGWLSFYSCLVERPKTPGIDVEKSSSHHLSQTEIGSDNPCYQQLSACPRFTNWDGLSPSCSQSDRRT